MSLGAMAQPCPPSLAPGASHSDQPARRWSLRRGIQNMLWIYVSGLVFLAFAAAYLAEDRPSPGLLAVRIVLVVIIGLAYVFTAWVCDLPLRARVVYLCGFVGLLGVGTFFWGWDSVFYGVYVSIMIATLLPWRASRVVVPVWSVAVAGTFFVSHETAALFIGAIGLGIGLATGGGMEAGRVSAALTAAERQVATLAVASERERISRDLHDILGHSLTAVTIKAGLAARLVPQDPTAAVREIGEIELIAREALADVRATATGMREVRAATELASARSVLEAAGIDCQAPTAVPPLPPQRSELFGYVIREAVTNVVRHSGAQRCTITVTDDRVEIRDDGRGHADDHRGSGLAGLAARVEQGGGTWSSISRDGVGTVVSVIMHRSGL